MRVSVSYYAGSPPRMQLSMPAVAAPTDILHWPCVQASSLLGGARMARDAITSLPAMVAYLLGVVGGLAWRAVHVFVGTYQSAEWKVRRAGAVADLNAAVLCAAVILLWTSRNAFTEAQDVTSSQAWVRQLAERPVDACNTLDREPFQGKLFHGITLHCEMPGHQSKEGLLHFLDVPQVLAALEVYNDCGAFSMAYGVQPNPLHPMLRTGKKGVGAALQTFQLVSRVVKEVRNGMHYLDVVRSDLGSCHAHQGSGKSSKPESNVQCAGLCGGCAEVPAPAQVLRYLTESSDAGLFLFFDGTYVCHPEEVDACFERRRPDWRSLNFTNSLDVGSANGFCPAPGRASIMWKAASVEQYHCADGFDVSQGLSRLKDKVDGLKLIYKFVYFYPCLSYDELFGLYIAMVGILVATCFGTGVLLYTDVVCPMLKYGSKTWAASLPPVPGMHASALLGSFGMYIENRVRASGVAGAAEWGFQAGQGSSSRKDLVDIVLRCTMSATVGTLVSAVCVLAPWYALGQYYKGSCKHLEQPAPFFTCASGE